MTRYDYERTYPNVQRYAIAIALLILGLAVCGFAHRIPLLFSYETQVEIAEGMTQTTVVLRSTLDTQKLFVGWIASLITVFATMYILCYTLFLYIATET